MRTIKKYLYFLLYFIITTSVCAQNESIQIIEDSLSFSRGEAIYSGTLSRPANLDTYPLVILISGMGMQDRDWTFAGGKYKMAKEITAYLNQKGIAVYRYDDRGHGKSTGASEMTTSFEDLSEDIYQAVLTLRKIESVSKIGLLGHSLGGILSIMTASNHKEIDFIITLSGSYQNGSEIQMEQARTLKRWRTSDDMSEEDVISTGEKFVQALLSYSNGGDGLETMEEILSDLIHYQISSLTKEQLEENLKYFKDTTDFIEKSYQGALEYYTSPHQMSFTSYDPSEGLKKVTCPILILFGEKDNHVTINSNIPKVSEAIIEGNFSDLTIKIVPEADHVKACKQ